MTADFATDTANLQAADSFLQQRRLGDPYAARAFDRAASAFCSGARLICPLPNQAPGQTPVLLERWESLGQGNVKFLLNAGGNPDHTATLARVEGTRFFDFLGRNASQVARWALFQFSHDIADQYISRTSEDFSELEAVADATCQRHAAAPIAELGKQMNALLSAHAATVPEAYRAASQRPVFGNLVNFAVAYTMSVYVRGIPYAFAVSRESAGTIAYTPAWVRRAAIVQGIDAHVADLRIEHIRTPSHFHWGPVLRALTEQGAMGHGSAVQEKLLDTMAALHESYVSFSDEVNLIVERSADPDHRRAQLFALVVGELHRAKVQLPSAHKSHEHHLWLALELAAHGLDVVFPGANAALYAIEMQLMFALHPTRQAANRSEAWLRTMSGDDLAERYAITAVSEEVERLLAHQRTAHTPISRRR